MENEDSLNRDATVEVGPNLGSVGGLVGENGQSQERKKERKKERKLV